MRYRKSSDFLDATTATITPRHATVDTAPTALVA
jgi:hypothetical protein